MKNQINTLVQILAGITLASSATFAIAADNGPTTVNGGTVHFKGEIVAAPCAVAAGSIDQTVNMGQVRTSAFATTGATSSAVPFNIRLEDCDVTVVKTASVSFNGPNASGSQGLLAVSNIIGGGATGAATGVGIEISDNTGAAIKADGTAFSNPYNLINGANILPFTARYKSTGTVVTAGRADADATFQIKYE